MESRRRSRGERQAGALIALLLLLALVPAGCDGRAAPAFDDGAPPRPPRAEPRDRPSCTQFPYGDLGDGCPARDEAPAGVGPCVALEMPDASACGAQPGTPVRRPACFDACVETPCPHGMPCAVVLGRRYPAHFRKHGSKPVAACGRFHVCVPEAGWPADPACRRDGDRCAGDCSAPAPCLRADDATYVTAARDLLPEPGARWHPCDRAELTLTRHSCQHLLPPGSCGPGGLREPCERDADCT